MDYSLIILFLIGALSFSISTITGGGGAMMLLPILNFWFGVKSTAPIINLAMTIGRPARLIIFWKHIDWRMSFYYIPSALIGVWFGSLIILNLPTEWFQVIVGLFLISTLFQYKYGKRKRSFTMKNSYFIPLGLIVGFLGTITGGLGPVLNPFYLNSGLEKEELIATKTANSFFVGIAQVLVYSQKDILTQSVTIDGIILGSGIIVGTLIGKKYLKRISSTIFHKLFILTMILSGVLLLLRSISILTAS